MGRGLRVLVPAMPALWGLRAAAGDVCGAYLSAGGVCPWSAESGVSVCVRGRARPRAKSGEGASAGRTCPQRVAGRGVASRTVAEVPVVCAGRALPLPRVSPGWECKEGGCGGVCLHLHLCVESVCNCVYGAELIFGLGFRRVSMPLVGGQKHEIAD